MRNAQQPTTREDQIFAHLSDARSEFGRSRLKLGLLLDVVKREELWRGRAESFADLLDDYGLNPKGAQQFMRVARSLFDEHGLPPSTIDQLVCVSMSILELAVRVMTPENRETVVGLVSALKPRDARCALNEMAQCDGIDPGVAGSRDPTERAIARVLDAYSGLADEQRYEVRARLRITPQRVCGTGGESSP